MMINTSSIIAAAGSFTELTYSVPSRLKTVLGYLAYLVKGAELLPQVKKVPVRITHDEGVFEGGLSMIFVALTNSVGGFETIAQMLNWMMVNLH